MPKSTQPSLPVPPLPPGMKHLAAEGTRPIHLKRGDVARLLEHWGFTTNGGEYVKKLEGNGLLVAVRKKAVGMKLYETREVLALYDDT